jgi:hypothetical protein
MTLIEIIYFVVVTFGASFAASWVYYRKGLILAIVTFAVPWGLCIRFFFTGGFSRLVVLIFKRADLKD